MKLAATRIPTSGLHGAALREAAAGEFREIAALLHGAIRAHLGRPPEQYVPVEAMYADRIVVSHPDERGRLLAYPYTLSDDNRVTFGTPVEVVTDHKPVAMREATPGAFIEAEGDAPRFRIRVIRAGLSKNRNMYPAAVLREAVPLFEGVRAFVKSDEEHLQGKGKSFTNLIGRLTAPRFVEADGGAIEATLELLESAGPVTAKIREAYRRDMADSLFGFSIDARAVAKRGRGGIQQATRIVEVKSLDLIIEPSAGGQIIDAIEAVNEDEEHDVKLRERMIAAIEAANGGQLPTGLDVENEQALLEAYNEIHTADAGKSGDAGAGAGAGAPGAVTRDDLDQTVAMIEARAEARVLIAESGLPDKAKDKLRKAFAGRDRYTVADVREALADEREYLASLTESGKVRGLGDRVEAGQDRSEKVTAMLDDFFDASKGARSFRECYVEITGDRRVTGLMQNVDMQRLREAVGEANMREAISAATFADVLGNSITRAMVREYNGATDWQDWRDLVDVVPVNDFRTQERARVGGYGNLPAVAENGAYNALTSPGDEKATYALSKRGGTETISLETIANDDVGLIRRIPMKLGVAAARTLYEFVLDFLKDNAAIYDTVALFHASHANLGAAALADASFAAARLRMQKQAEADSSKRLGLVLRHVYVPLELEETAFNMFVRGTNNDETFVQSRKPRVHTVPYWTDANNWYATADKSQVPLIEVGFYGGQEEPELFVQDLPTQGSLFSNDQVKYKIRHIYSGAVQDFRGFDGSIVA